MDSNSPFFSPPRAMLAPLVLVEALEMPEAPVGPRLALVTVTLAVAPGPQARAALLPEVLRLVDRVQALLPPAPPGP